MISLETCLVGFSEEEHILIDLVKEMIWSL